jgi:HlyD family secretion protein
MSCPRWATLVIVALLCASCAQFTQEQSRVRPAAEAASPIDTATRIVALGQIRPKGEVIHLSVPNAEDSRVNQILVKEGDFVKAEQVIAVLQGFERRNQDLQEAQKTVELYHAKLNQLMAGEGKQSEITAQNATIAELEAQQRNQALERQAAIASAEAELRQAQLTHERNTALVAEGALSQAELDQSRETLAAAKANLIQRQAQLDNTIQTIAEQIAKERSLLSTFTEVRPADMQVAQAELARAEIAVEQRQADQYAGGRAGEYANGDY